VSGPDESSDDYLVRRAQEGYLDAYAQLVDRHSPRAYRVALRLLGNHHDAEDVTQDAFVVAWESLPRYRHEASFSTWLYRITTNRAINLANRRARADQQDPHDALQTEADPSPGPAQQAELLATSQALRDAIAELPMEQRVPLVLRQFEKLSYAEIAEICGSTVPAIRSHLHRGRRALASQLEGWR